MLEQQIRIHVILKDMKRYLAVTLMVTMFQLLTLVICSMNLPEQKTVTM